MPPEGHPPAEQPDEPGARPPAERAPERDLGPRASDAERNQAIDQLRAAYVEGRLDQEEFDERSSAALMAKTIGQLELLFHDLPDSYRHGAPSYQPHSPGPVVRPSPGGGNRVAIAVMSGVERKGAWQVPVESTAFALMGGIELDLREAILSGQVTNINAVAIMAGIEIIVPPGIRVESSGFGFMGGWDNHARNDRLGPNAPVLRVRGVAFMGGVEIKTKELPAPPDRRPIEGPA
jgi:hypothetical protein